MPETEFENWVMRLVSENMPVFTRTVQSVAGMASRENCSLSELAWTILEDPSLTTQVLKLANSIYYNPGSRRISTVSRAVMRLGSDAVKEICLAISLIETVLPNLHKKKVALEISRVFHAAVQARKMATRRKLSGPEEIFIAALLTRIGNIVFWCFAGEAGEKLEDAISHCECEEAAEMEILGFKLERLTLRLSQEWRLSDLLESVYIDRKGLDPRVKSIKLGCAVAMASENGWDSPEIKELVTEVSEFLQLPEDETIKTLYESAKTAAEITVSYGARDSSRLVPLPEEVQPPPAAQVVEMKPKYPKPDPNIQLCSLRDMSTLVASGKGDVNMVLSIVLEGIYRGIGMDRVVFALLTPDRHHIIGKYGLGCVEEGWGGKVSIGTGSGTPNIFSHLLKKGKPVWVTEKPESDIKALLTKEVSPLTGGGAFFAVPVTIRGTTIGFICAARNKSGRTLDEESFESFAFFGHQANMSLSMLSSG